ncbi:MAG TPA: hypothetical protein VKR82_04395 [Candidatus Acidoferrales bacterium]|nr:hypothetical protein [Candidatus Acidoferrales bacterium]
MTAPGVLSQKANTRSPHGPLALACDNCHIDAGWRPIRSNPEFDHNKTRYPLRGMHEKVLCNQCHVKPVFTDVGKNCADCHADIHLRKFGADCAQCHTVRGWQVSLSSIKEHQNRFPLIGAHAAVDCEACHKSAAVGQFQGLSTDCNSCHLTDFQKATNPSHTALNFPTNCQVCHSMDSWLGAKFDHLKFTGYALTGAHATLDCLSCHIGGKYQGTPTDCFSCHVKDFNGTTNPPHAQAGIPTTCSTCHTTVAWSPATFDHSKTSFPLTGAHAAVPCASCHINGNFTSTPTDCFSCHVKDFNGTTNPNHSQAGIPTTCAVCHTTSAWQPATFDHNKTSFPLTGAHVSVPCSSCHINNNYSSIPSDCYSCHTKDFNGTTNPPHASTGIPTTCAVCHNTSAWQPATFDHSKTSFPLTGAHITVACALCHINGNYTTTPSDCYSCHTKDFNGTTNPPHVSAGIPTTCATCHSTTAWQPATFDHNKTAFPLTGFHVTVPCTSCHLNGNFTNAPTDCYGCHKPDYDGTNAPPHAAAGFATTCQTCHTTTSWAGVVFNHATTGFPLTGTHVTTPCASCHINNNYSLTDPTCKACHTPDYNGTNNPPHAAASYPLDCTLCHNTVNWTSSTWNHSSTGFPLTGFHTTILCTACHIGNNYGLTDPTCKACHLPDYNTTNNPPHAAAGFPVTCDTCHTTTSWAGAVFDHSKTAFPLTGFHVTVPCTSCHVNNNFTTVPTDCYGCHAADYNGTNNPNHIGAGYPTTCASCHNTTSWAGATFNHTYFQIPHHSAQCTDCHTNSSNYVIFACTTNCHAKSATDPHHSGVSGYTYTPTSCYGCHKQ